MATDPPVEIITVNGVTMHQGSLGHEMAVALRDAIHRADAAEAREVALRGRIEAERRYFAGSPSWLSATQSAAVTLRFSAALAAEPTPPAAPHAEDDAL